MMIYGVLLISLVVTLVLLVVALRPGGEAPRNISEVLAQSRAVDVQAFQNLVDEDEDTFLRAELNAAEFRRVQRKRMRAALGYVRCTLHNSKVLLAFGQAARKSPNPAVARAGFELVQSALQLRVYSLLGMGVFSMRMMFPTVRVSCSWLVNSYGRMRECAGGLVRIEGPAYGSRLEASI